MTQTSTDEHDWTRALSTSTLERIYTQTTDRKSQAEIKAELDRRDDEADLITDPAEIEQIKARLQYTAGAYEKPYDDA